MGSPYLLVGVTILLWSSFAALLVRLNHLPPLLLVGLALGIGSLPSLPRARQWFSRPGLLAFGTAGMFGYHLLLFLALRLAPPVEANLLNYLWPVLMVFLAGLVLPGRRLGLPHALGALMAFIGAALVITGGRTSFESRYLAGYSCAVGAAAIWAVYSVLPRRMAPFPTSMVGGFCLVSSLLALAGHALFEPPAILSGQDWGILLAIGLGPMGLAFYSWDASLKRGDPRLIGALSYLVPVLSTLWLALTWAGGGITRTIVAALALIVGGSALSSMRPGKGAGRRRKPGR
jgi:drug/metabolite transporter (DMT)-like permease